MRAVPGREVARNLCTKLVTGTGRDRRGEKALKVTVTFFINVKVERC
jgi:hypothetical protein